MVIPSWERNVPCNRAKGQSHVEKKKIQKKKTANNKQKSVKPLKTGKKEENGARC